MGPPGEEVTPAEVAVGETLDFVLRALGTAPLRLLEVGGGRGELAAALQARGHAVTMIDPDPEAVAAARAAGVTALPIGLLEHEGGPYEAVLFVRSLHHLDEPRSALARTERLLAPRGLVVVEEFARERADLLTAAMAFDLETILAAAGVLRSPPRDEEAGPETDPLRRWQARYGRERGLPGGAEIRALLEERFQLVRAEPCPYLYRHLGQWLEPSERGAAVARALLEVERARLERGELAPLGLRLIARRRP
ncbi:MAG TPA: methyltransferase domain-containing protein [Candidatus Dormibacteraeota bacterium]|jgi:SAM-dependent methyltransferase|nr:methyltransferase domain-containing protein [Candidatus Dormibacteraeota bacterium]